MIEIPWRVLIFYKQQLNFKERKESHPFRWKEIGDPLWEDFA